MFKLMRFVKGPAIFFAILAPLLMIIEVMMDLALPTLLASIIDRGIVGEDIEYIFATGTQMLLFAFIGLVGGVSCVIFSTLAGVSLGERLREGLYEKIQTLSTAEIDQLETSSLITRLTGDITQVQMMFTMGLRVLVRAPLLCLGGLFMAFRLSRELSLIFLVIFPLILALIWFVLTRSFPMFRRMQEKVDRVNHAIRENLLGVRVIKAFNLEQNQQNRFDGANIELMNQGIEAGKMMLILNPVVTLIINFSVVAVLWYGGYLVQGGWLEAGRIMAFINYLTQIMMSLMFMLMIMMNMSRAKASAQRINEVFNLEPSIKESVTPLSASAYDLEFRDVSFQYHAQGEEVLSHLSFKIKEGQQFGIIGATGSGKSSLVHLIPRLYDVSEGEILLGGVNIKALSLKELRESIGLVLQENVLFSGTIASNLKFGYKEATKMEMERAAADAQASEFIAQKEEGYDALVQQRGKNLSGGQKQRLAIGRTLIGDPKLVILDDSSSALDMKTEQQLKQALQDRLQHCTVILIAQRISTVKDADQILVLDDGKISGIGTHQELLMHNEIYRSIALSQLGEEVLSNE